MRSSWIGLSNHNYFKRESFFENFLAFLHLLFHKARLQSYIGLEIYH